MNGHVRAAGPQHCGALSIEAPRQSSTAESACRGGAAVAASGWW